MKVESGSTRRVCTWCKRPLSPDSRPDAKFCGVRCRQNSWRFAINPARVACSCTRPLSFAYADPPYPGKAHYYSQKREVDHLKLIRRLMREFPDGWALSTSSQAVPMIAPLIPDARLCVWVKAPRKVRAFHAVSSWEALFIMGGRAYSGSVSQDLSDALFYQGRHRAFPGALVGMKPPAFCEWMFRQLNATAGDSLTDLFPGSGAVMECWKRFTDPNATSMKPVEAAVAIQETSNGDEELATAARGQ